MSNEGVLRRNLIKVTSFVVFPDAFSFSSRKEKQGEYRAPRVLCWRMLA